MILSYLERALGRDIQLSYHEAHRRNSLPAFLLTLVIKIIQAKIAMQESGWLDWL